LQNYAIRATQCVNFYACRGIRALITVIRNTVVVGVKRATVSVNFNASRSTWALITVIRHAVTVRI
tara:strand:+ start:39 stop:236 length:198 start_codon:yes stop_codon:yes gene_type:complete